MFIADTKMANKIHHEENIQLQLGIPYFYSFHKLSKRNLYHEEFRDFAE